MAQRKTPTDDDDDIGSLYREWHEAKKEKRALNRKRSKDLLIKRGIRLDEHAGGVHLVIYHVDGLRVYDFWPGTGLWKLRGGTATGRGVYNLLLHYNDPLNKKGRITK